MEIQSKSNHYQWKASISFCSMKNRPLMEYEARERPAAHHEWGYLPKYPETVREYNPCTTLIRSANLIMVECWWGRSSTRISQYLTDGLAPIYKGEGGWIAMGNLLLPSIRTITSSIDSSSGHLLHFRCAITNGTVQRFVMNQILMKLDFNQVQQMCDWNDNFFQGCGCPSSCDKIRRCRRGDCQTTTTDPRQNVTVVWLPGKCDRHKYLTPSSSEGSFP